MSLEVDVVVIGGGATGVGIVRDLVMRGFSAALLERADLAQGTTGRFHGLLHSGGRYVVSDPRSATECAEENEILRRIHADAVEETGGLFVVGPDDPDDYPEQFLSGARATGVPAEELPLAAALAREPRINRGIKRAFEVRDATIDGWAMVWGATRSAQDLGAHILTYHRATAIHSTNGQVTGVSVRNEKTGEDVTITCRFAINAAGPWAGQVAELAGCDEVEVVAGRGIMVAMNHRLVNSVINRCIYPADGDILVPVHTVSIIGTTDARAADPDFLEIPRAEVAQMMAAGEVLVPGFTRARALHAWAGARPLVKDKRVAAGDTRHMSRGMSIIDHSERDALSGFLTIAGGKLTTYRLMAKNTVDIMCAQMGEDRQCVTETVEVPTAKPGHTYQVTHRLAEREHERKSALGWLAGKAKPKGAAEAVPVAASARAEVICECELVTRGMIEDALADQPDATIDDLRRQLRIGMGPCQGGFCAVRTAGIVHESRATAAGPVASDALEGAQAPTAAPEPTSPSHGTGISDASLPSAVENADRSSTLLRLFLANRWQGVEPILVGRQAREAALDLWTNEGTLAISALPPGSAEARAATGDLATLIALEEKK